MPNLQPKSLCHQSRSSSAEASAFGSSLPFRYLAIQYLIGEIQSLSVWIWMPRGIEWLLRVLLWGQSTLKLLHKMTIIQKMSAASYNMPIFDFKTTLQMFIISPEFVPSSYADTYNTFYSFSKKILGRNNFGSSNTIL